MNIERLTDAVNGFLAGAGGPFYFGEGGARLYPRASAGSQRAGHPFFSRIPGLIPGHLRPLDFFRNEFPGRDPASGLTVLSFAFHINREIVADNAREELYPSRSWYECRRNFDFIIPEFLRFLSGLLPGTRIAAPFTGGLYKADLSRPVPAANWSERHVAFACGLGSFGLHGALITEWGCAHRLLSVIVDAEIEGGGEPPEDPYRDCLHFARGECGACIARCPVGAIVPGEHIIERCYGREQVTNRKHSAEILGVEEPACGLCMCGVPCDTAKPR